MEEWMSRFEPPNNVRDQDSLLNKYRPKTWRANHTESDRAEYLNFDASTNPIDKQSIRSPVEGDNTERSDPNSVYPAASSPSMNSSTINLRGHNDQPSHSRLDAIAEALRTLTYGEMLELAESVWKLNPQGSEITELALPNVLYRWSKSRSTEK
jgi:hypothetical protein